jgi:glutamyl-tRNA reductase
MPLYMLGLDYSNAPVDVREAYWLSAERIRTCLTPLFATHGLPQCSPHASTAGSTEIAILSTCNRVEIYVAVEAAATGVTLPTWLLQVQCPAHGKMVRSVNHYRNRAAVEHLLRIATGLDPLPLGEPYILDQLVDALFVARGCGASGPVLAHLFHRATQIGKRADAETAIDQRSIFLSRAAVDLLGQRHPELTQGKLLLVGASKLAHWAAQALQYMTPQPTAFINRTAAHAEAMSRYAPDQTFPWHQMRRALAWSDVVVTATAALHPVLDADDIVAALEQRRGRPLFLIDLGFPRNIHPAAADIPNVIYYDLNDLSVALAELAHAEIAHVESPEPWVASLPVVEWMVQDEASALWALLDGTIHPDNRRAGT